MRRNLIHAVFGLVILVFTTAIYPQWTQTNWPASNSYFNLYASQDRVFARTWDSINGGQMFITADNGTNWTLVSPADGNVDILSAVQLSYGLLAGTWNGFYQSTLDGASWNAVTPAGIPADSAILSISMINSNLFAGARGTIYKSSDNGVSWTEANSGIPANCRISSFISNGSAIFAGSDTNGVFRTTNDGASWSAVNSGLADKNIVQLVAMGTRLFAVTLKGVFISDNNGASWTANGSSLTNINCLHVVNDMLYAGTDSSGVYLSIDDGATWSSFGTGIPAGTRVWSLALCGGNLFAGTSCGVWRTPINLVEFTINASATQGGTISPQGAVTVYEHGSQTFTISPATGYRVSDVIVDGASAGAVASYTFSNISADHTIEALFAAVPSYTIDASAESGGTISPSGAVTVYEGSTQNFVITPSAGFAIASVTVDGSPIGAVSTYTFSNVNENHTIAATFVVAPIV